MFTPGQLAAAVHDLSARVNALEAHLGVGKHAQAPPEPPPETTDADAPPDEDDGTTNTDTDS